jgi:hypothetical protein
MLVPEPPAGTATASVSGTAVTTTVRKTF